VSLDCLGKIKLARTDVGFSFPSDVAIRTEIDDGDVEEFDRVKSLFGDGIFFSICDDPNGGDATGLWVEAMDLGISRILESHLGRAVHALFFDSRICVGGLAFVDGGIETIWEGAPEDCWRWFLERIEKPWDTIDNPLLIWRSVE